MSPSRLVRRLVPLAAAGGALWATAAAAAPPGTAYPIAELGSCRDERECYFYCQAPENQAACWWWANVTGPSGKVLQAASPALPDFVRIAGQTLSIPEAETYCSDWTKAALCYAAAAAAGITPALHPGYIKTVQNLGVTVPPTNLAAFVLEAMEQWAGLPEGPQTTAVRALLDSGVPPEDLPPLTRAVAALYRLDSGVYHPSDAARYCGQTQNHEACASIAEKVGIPGGYQDGFGPIASVGEPLRGAPYPVGGSGAEPYPGGSGAELSNADLQEGQQYQQQDRQYPQGQHPEPGPDEHDLFQQPPATRQAPPPVSPQPGSAAPGTMPAAGGPAAGPHTSPTYAPYYQAPAPGAPGGEGYGGAGPAPEGSEPAHSEGGGSGEAHHYY